MLAEIRQFLNEIAGGRTPERFTENDEQLAAAALLYHATAIDGTVSETEKVKLRELLARRFKLDPAATETLIKAAAEAESEAVDLYGFTSILKRQLDEPARERIVGMMWELVFADGQLHEFEDNLVWRTAELLGVSSQARIRLKQAARRGGRS